MASIPVVVAVQDVVVFRSRPPIAQQRHAFGQIGAAGDGGAAFAVGAEVLARIEAEAADIAE
jgi:hypothetical protein